MKLLLHILVFAAGLFNAYAEEALTVYVFAGQSNMMGRGSDYSELPSQLKSQENVLIFDGTQWQPFTPLPDQRFGPEISCAAELSKKLGRQIGIIKHGKGGTNLASDWNPDDPKSLYTMLKQKVDAACVSRPVQIAGMFWMQGENDSKNQEMAEAYGRNLDAFIQRARKDFNSPEMAFIAGRANPPKESFPYVDQVRAAQEQCSVPGYSYVNCDDLAKIKDRLHYDTAGLVMLGKRFADVAAK